MVVSYNPYSKGRWYRFFVESNGSVRTITDSDIKDAVLEGNLIKLPLGYRILNVVSDVNCIPSATDSFISNEVSLTTEGKQAITLPDASVFDYAYIYVFANNV